MPNIAQVLKEEITRLARKETRALCASLQKQVRDLRQTVRDQKGTIAQLKKKIDRLDVLTGQPAEKILEAPDVDKEAKVRISPASIKKNRQRLKLSQREFGRLLNVSANTVVRWEAGTSKPRSTHRSGLAQLRTMGVREVKKLLIEE